MKIIIYLFILFYFSDVTLHAQTPIAITHQDIPHLAGLGLRLYTGLNTFDQRYEAGHSTPYLYNSWKKGVIKFVEQDSFCAPVNIYVDLLKQLLYVKLQDGSIGQIPASYIQVFKLLDDNETWIVAPEKDIENNGNRLMKFYKQLYVGQFQLLKSVEKQFRKTDDEGTYADSGTRSDEYNTDISYWLQDGAGPYKEIALQRQNIEKDLKIYGDEIEKITKNNKLSLNNEEDIIQLLKLLDISCNN